MVAQEAPLDALHWHPAWVVTATLPDPPEALKDWLAGAIV
jgi:hypothetical protein